MAELESKIQDLSSASHPRWRIRKGWFSISTTDRPQIDKYSGSFRLVYGTNDVQKFQMNIWKESGHIVTAWISDWTPRSEMAKMEKFSVSEGYGGSFEILAKARTNESVAMEFVVTFIVE